MTSVKYIFKLQDNNVILACKDKSQYCINFTKMEHYVYIDDTLTMYFSQGDPICICDPSDARAMIVLMNESPNLCQNTTHASGTLLLYKTKHVIKPKLEPKYRCYATILTDINKLDTIKELRLAFTGLGLREAKDIVDFIWNKGKTEITNFVNLKYLDPAVLPLKTVSIEVQEDKQ